MIQFTRSQWDGGIGGVYDAMCGGWMGTGRTQKTAAQRLKKRLSEDLNAKNPEAARLAAECLEVVKKWLKDEGSKKENNLNIWGEKAWGKE